MGDTRTTEERLTHIEIKMKLVDRLLTEAANLLVDLDERLKKLEKAEAGSH